MSNVHLVFQQPVQCNKFLNNKFYVYLFWKRPKILFYYRVTFRIIEKGEKIKKP